MRFYHINYLRATICTPYIPSPLLHVYFISSIINGSIYPGTSDFNFSYTGTGICACLALHLPCASVKITWQRQYQCNHHISPMSGRVCICLSTLCLYRWLCTFLCVCRTRQHAAGRKSQGQHNSPAGMLSRMELLPVQYP